MLKSLVLGFVVVDLVVVVALVAFATLGDGGLTAWVLAAIWTVALVVVPVVAVRPALRQQP